MKKKGLIISTVVMVVVLIASLTTATYAWFTAETQTTVNGFSIEVAPGSAVVVGFKNGTGWNSLATAETLNDSMFQSGNVTFTQNEGWVGDAEGLTPTLTPTINIGTEINGKYIMATAVGKTTAATITEANQYNTGLWNTKNATNTIVANKGSNRALTGQVEAVPNSDYAHFILGAQASKTLTSLKFAITVTSSNKTTLGMAAATHIAFRRTGETDWTDVDMFDKDQNPGLTTSKSCTASTRLTDVPEYTLTGSTTKKNAGSATYYFDLDVVNINQIEIVVYLAGSDPDCTDAAKGAIATISMDFIAVEAE